MERMSTNPTEYVVFDVETNGLDSKKYDLLSISFYKPDDGKEYTKFLPLELNAKVLTTKINGITERDLEGATAFTQEDFNYIVEEFELEKRKILIYAGSYFDKIFFSAYMKRHRITGIERLNFCNIKENIISSRYANGNITKDNLCKMFKIEGVKSVHSASNDCKLEWELFKKMDGYYYFVTDGETEDNVFRFNDGYIVPASFLTTHPHLSRLLPGRPYIECESKIIKTFEIEASGIEKFETNITGMTIEHLINSMLHVNKQDSYDFLLANKKKLSFVGKIPNNKNTIPLEFNSDGTVLAIRKSDKEIEKRINSTNLSLKGRIQPLVDYIKNEIFKNEQIMSQELVVDYKNNILAKCDLSSESAVLEIKTNDADSLAFKEQLFYESRGRAVYHLRMDWVKDWKTYTIKKIVFKIVLVDVCADPNRSSAWTRGKREEKREKRLNEIREHLASSDIALVSFTNTSSPIGLRCKSCGATWILSYTTLMKKIPNCPKCQPKTLKHKENTKEHQAKPRVQNFNEKVAERSSHTIIATNYVGAKANVDAVCMCCQYKWTIRADHLLNRCWCPKCKRKRI